MTRQALLFPLFWMTVVAAACGQEDTTSRLASRGFPLVGVPEDGYPGYQERLMLVAINRARADPNVEGETKAACSADYPARKPLMLSLAGSRCSRFHCANCIINDGGLSHDSYCTLRSDIGDTFESSCDGAASCACEPGSEHFSCNTLGGHGTSPWSRCGYFGYSADGEVGAAGYADGWEAVWGWVSECAGQDGHRRILTGVHNQIGLGYYSGPTACWSSLYFGDTGGGGPATYTLPAGVHYPERGRSTSFYLNVYDPGGDPREVNLVLDGHCHQMQLEIGTAGQGTYKLSIDMGSGCHRYWFLVRDSAGQRATWPEQGAWGAGDCSDYQPQAPAADCEPGSDGGSGDGGSDGGGDSGGDGGGDTATAGDDGGASGDDGLAADDDWNPDDGTTGDGGGSADDSVTGDDGGDNDTDIHAGREGEPVVQGGCSCGRQSPAGCSGIFWMVPILLLRRKKKGTPRRGKRPLPDAGGGNRTHMEASSAGF